MTRTGNAILLRSVEDLADAKELRAEISIALAHAPIDESALRSAVCSFVAAERRAGVPPALVITRLTALIDDAPVVPMAPRHSLTRRVILWCVEEYFGASGGEGRALDALADSVRPAVTR
jgi:hypothetical protein